jgi:hypothetical protein
MDSCSSGPGGTSVRPGLEGFMCCPTNGIDTSQAMPLSRISISTAGTGELDHQAEAILTWISLGVDMHLSFFCFDFRGLHEFSLAPPPSTRGERSDLAMKPRPSAVPCGESDDSPSGSGRCRSLLASRDVFRSSHAHQEVSGRVLRDCEAT